MASKKKLKAEIQELREQLMTVALEPDSLRAMVIKSRCQVDRAVENGIWQGGAVLAPTFGGLLSKVGQ